MFEIVSEADFFYSGTADELFTCTFYCRTEDGIFPDDEWTDFAQTVLCWWGETMLGITNVDEVTFRLLFEDGPYWITGKKQNDIVTLHFCTDKKSVRTIANTELKFQELASAIEKAMRHFASNLYMSGNTIAAQQMQDEAVRIRRAILKR